MRTGQKRQNRFKTVYIDLDGPILDVSDRYYRVHRSIVAALGERNRLTKGEYWKLKRNKAALFKINRSLTGDRAAAYRKHWLHAIEQKKFLVYDKVLPHVRRSLKKLSINSRLVLVTARMKKNNLLWELKQKGLYRYFKKIYTANPRGGLSVKEKILRGDPGFDPHRSLIIGDTEVDIAWGKKYGLFTVAVLSGIRNREHLLSLHPDICVDNLKGCVEKLST